MEAPRFDCNCDIAVAMEEMGVRVEDILQYAHACLPKRHVHELIRGLQEISDDHVSAESVEDRVPQLT